MKQRNFFIASLFSVIILLFCTMLTVFIIDPYCHYRQPRTWLKYRLSNERYVNDGISKNFDYNAIITGTSMTENFKSSQLNDLFEVNSIKIPYSGGSFKEINDNVGKALCLNSNILLIFRGIDYGSILEDSNKMRYDSYPTYMYDDNIWNDYKYLLNKEIIIKGIGGVVYYTLKNKNTTNFDEFVSWRSRYKYGKDEVLKRYIRPLKINREAIKNSLTEEEIKIIDENIEKNVFRYSKEYPKIKFIYFITPYSIVYWDKLNQQGDLLKQLQIEKHFIEKALQYKNIELYSFFNNYELITNLNNYKDPNHYSGDVNDQILEWIHEGKYRLTKENYMEYLNKNREFYVNYDYDSIFSKK